MSDAHSKVDRAAIAAVLKTAPCRCVLTRWASSSCADGRRRLSWPSCHACRAIVCRLSRTYSEGEYHRCICRESRAFQQSNYGFYGHARLTGRLVVPVGAECDRLKTRGTCTQTFTFTLRSPCRFQVGFRRPPWPG